MHAIVADLRKRYDDLHKLSLGRQKDVDRVADETKASRPEPDLSSGEQERGRCSAHFGPSWALGFSGAEDEEER